jgi:hypothetical protein
MRYLRLAWLGCLMHSVCAFAQTAPTDSATTLALTVLKRDLRAYVVAQERFFAPNEIYAGSVAPLVFERDSLTTVKIVASSRDGHSAIATHRRAPTIQCAVWVGSAEAPFKDGSQEGIPSCRTSALAP